MELFLSYWHILFPVWTISPIHISTGMARKLVPAVKHLYPLFKMLICSAYSYIPNNRLWTETADMTSESKHL